MNDVEKINKELDKLNLLWEEKRQQIEKLIAQRVEEKDQVLKMNLRKKIDAAEAGRSDIEEKQEVELRKLARTTEEGEKIGEKYDNLKTLQKEEKKELEKLSEKWNGMDDCPEKEELRRKREELDAERKSIEEEKKAIVLKLNEMGKSLREQYKAGTLVVEEPVEEKEVVAEEKSEVEAEAAEEVKAEAVVETETVEEEKPLVEAEEAEKVEDTKIVPIEEILGDDEEYLKKIQEQTESLEEKREFGQTKQAKFQIQEGISKVAKIRNIIDEYKEKFAKDYEKMPPEIVSDPKEMIANLERLEAMIAKRYGLDELEKVMNAIDDVITEIENTTDEAVLRETVMESLDNLQNMVSEKGGDKIKDKIEEMKNYTDSIYLSEPQLREWLLEDLAELGNELPENFGAKAQERISEPGIVGEWKEAGVAPDWKEGEIIGEWKAGMQKVEEKSSSEAETAATVVPSEEKEEQQETDPEKWQKIQERQEEMNKINAVIEAKEKELDTLKEYEAALPEGGARDSVRKDIEKSMASLNAFKSRNTILRAEYSRLTNSKKDSKIHIKGIENSENEAKILDILERLGAMRVYREQFKQGSNIPDISLDTVESWMKMIPKIIKQEKKKTKRRTPERRELMEKVKNVNKVKKEVKKLMKDSKKALKEQDVANDYVVDSYDYEPEL